MPEQTRWDDDRRNESDNQGQEVLTSQTPEFYLQKPNPETQLIRVFPIRGEWNNGNLLLLLRNMFSQPLSKPVEVLFVANLGDKLDVLKKKDEWWRAIKKDDNYILNTESHRDDDDSQVRAKKTYSETQQTIAFLKLLWAIQNGEVSQEKMEELLNESPEYADILQAAKDSKLRINLVDATKWDVPQAYAGKDNGHQNMSAMRSLGVDVADLRYPDGTVPLTFGDVDTLDDANLMEDLAQVYADNPLLKELSIPMAYKPGLEDALQMTLSPKDSLEWAINYVYTKGSPQISARLDVFRQLDEVGDYDGQQGFIGNVDRDTATRTTFYFGEVNRLIALSHGFTVPLPTVVTTSRAQGFHDAMVAEYNQVKKRYFADVDDTKIDASEMQRKITEFRAERGGLEPINTPLTGALERYKNLRSNILKRIETDPEKDAVYAYYEKAKKVYERRLKGMRRMNHMVVESLLQLIQSNIITYDTDASKVQFDQHRVHEYMRLIRFENSKVLTPRVLENVTTHVLDVLNHSQDLIAYFAKHPALFDWLLSYIKSNEVPELSQEPGVRAVQEALLQYLGEVNSTALEGIEQGQPVDDVYQEGLLKNNSTYFAVLSDVLALSAADALFLRHAQVRVQFSPKDSWPANVAEQLTITRAEVEARQKKNKSDLEEEAEDSEFDFLGLSEYWKEFENEPVVKRSLAPRKQRLTWLQQQI